jgi:hypothetical protein
MARVVGGHDVDKEKATVCDEYLAPEGSPEAQAASAKAWPDL